MILWASKSHPIYRLSIGTEGVKQVVNMYTHRLIIPGNIVVFSRYFPMI